MANTQTAVQPHESQVKTFDAWQSLREDRMNEKAKENAARRSRTKKFITNPSVTKESATIYYPNRSLKKAA